MNVLKPLINELVKIVKQGVNLAKDELPIIAKQILKYYLWQAIALMVLGVIFLLTGAWCHLHANIPAVVERYHEADSNTGWWAAGAILSYLAGIALLFANIIDIIKIMVAPRLFLLEYLKGFLDNE